MWDYDKLFAENNVIGLKALHNDKIFVHGVSDECHWGETNRVDWHNFKNKELKVDGFEIQYIIRLDEHGNVAEKLFDRETDMPKPMPELETGMFVRVYSTHRKEGILALIYDNRAIYQDGEWDEIYDLTEDIVMEVYSDKALCFNNCQNPYLIWQNPLSNKTN